MNRFVYLIVVFVLCSCQSAKVEHKECSFSCAEKAKVSDIVRDYSIVCLETREDNLIVDPTVVRFSKDRIFVLDRFSPSKSLYVFQKDGKYIGKVGNKGEGPGEYVMPHYFVIDEKNDKLFLRDMATNKLLVYNLTTLAYIENYSLPFYATCFEKMGDDHFIWYVNAGLQNGGDFCKHIQITDIKCNSVLSAVDVMSFPTRGIYNVQSYFLTADARTYFHHPFMGDYYHCSLQDSVLHPAFTLHYDGLDFPSRDYIISHKDNIIKDTEENHLIQWCDVLKNSATYLSYLGTGKTLYWGVFSEKTAKGWYVEGDNLEDDLGIGKLTRPKTIYKDYFVSLLSTESIVPEELPDNSILKPYLDKIGGNPIILLYK